jgi:hypothetical protein
MEQLLICLEEPPWNALYRVTIGLAILPAMSRWYAETGSVGEPSIVLLSVLLALRLVPLAVRRLLPFSEPVQARWAERRQVSRRYDSYQWQKLFWIGLGLAVGIPLSANFGRSPIILASTCLLLGAIGLVIWQLRRSRGEAIRTQAHRAVVSLQAPRGNGTQM